jgi:uncharacterized protein (DUF2252 family)
MTSRDVVAEIVEYNKPLTDEAHRVRDSDGKDLTVEALSRKLEALSRSAFSFFRGTFHLMARDVLQGRVPHAAAAAPEALIVGDLHLENFGVYRGASGALCFDVNDFDDVGMGPADFDLKRLCTSAYLLPGVSQANRAAAAKAIASGWAEGVARIGGRFPVAAYDSKAQTPVAELMNAHGATTSAQMIGKAAPAAGHKQFDCAKEPRKYARVGKAWAHIAEKAFDEYLAALKQLKVPMREHWRILDTAYRFKGTGSLGRLRFSILCGFDEERRIVEIKEARPSALDEARGRAPSANRARAQTAAIRRLQGSPWPLVAGTHFGKVEALARELQAEEEKIGTDRFSSANTDATHVELVSYARQCGEVTARLHCRASAYGLLDDGSFDARRAAQEAVSFAERYAAQVEHDQKAYLHSRASIGKALGIAD